MWISHARSRPEAYCHWVAEEEGAQLGITPQMRRCIDATSDCYTVCSETLSYSLDDGGAFMNDRHLRLLIDAGEILQTTQNAMIRLSELSTMMAGVAESCRELDHSDPQPIACAESCEHTANCCHELAL